MSLRLQERFQKVAAQYDYPVGQAPTGEWFHISTTPLPLGTILVPGGPGQRNRKFPRLYDGYDQANPDQAGTHNRVFLTPWPEDWEGTVHGGDGGMRFGPEPWVYRVEPLAAVYPFNVNGQDYYDEYVTDRARVVEIVKEPMELEHVLVAKQASSPMLYRGFRVRKRDLVERLSNGSATARDVVSAAAGWGQGVGQWWKNSDGFGEAVDYAEIGGEWRDGEAGIVLGARIDLSLNTDPKDGVNPNGSDLRDPNSMIYIPRGTRVLIEEVWVAIPDWVDDIEWGMFKADYKLLPGSVEATA